MERFIVCFCIFCLLFTLVLGVYQPHAFRSWGLDLVRQYQLYRWRLETSRWPAVESGHFVIKYRKGDEENARLVLQEAERVYRPLGEFFGYFPDQKVPISIYTDRASLNRVFGWGNEESAMGVYWAGVLRILSPQAWLGDLSGPERDTAFRERGPVAHEYIHLLVDYKTKGNYPRWLTEGLAQYGEEKIAGADPFTQKVLPLTVSLEELDKRFDDPAWQDYSYGVAKDLVLYLVDRYGSDAVPRLLDALGRGDSLDKAFREATGSGIGRFLSGYERFARAV